jgi:hypothetical protein
MPPEPTLEAGCYVDWCAAKFGAQYVRAAGLLLESQNGDVLPVHEHCLLAACQVGHGTAFVAF